MVAAKIDNSSKITSQDASRAPSGVAGMGAFVSVRKYTPTERLQLLVEQIVLNKEDISTDTPIQKVVSLDQDNLKQLLHSGFSVTSEYEVLVTPKLIKYLYIIYTTIVARQHGFKTLVKSEFIKVNNGFKDWVSKQRDNVFALINLNNPANLTTRIFDKAVDDYASESVQRSIVMNKHGDEISFSDAASCLEELKILGGNPIVITRTNQEQFFINLANNKLKGDNPLSKERVTLAAEVQARRFFIQTPQNNEGGSSSNIVVLKNSRAVNDNPSISKPHQPNLSPVTGGSHDSYEPEGTTKPIGNLGDVLREITNISLNGVTDNKVKSEINGYSDIQKAVIFLRSYYTTCGSDIDIKKNMSDDRAFDLVLKHFSNIGGDKTKISNLRMLLLTRFISLKRFEEGANLVECFNQYLIDEYQNIINFIRQNGFNQPISYNDLYCHDGNLSLSLEVSSNELVVQCGSKSSFNLGVWKFRGGVTTVIGASNVPTDYKRFVLDYGVPKLVDNILRKIKDKANNNTQAIDVSSWCLENIVKELEGTLGMNLLGILLQQTSSFPFKTKVASSVNLMFFVLFEIFKKLDTSSGKLTFHGWISQLCEKLSTAPTSMTLSKTLRSIQSTSASGRGFTVEDSVGFSFSKRYLCCFSGKIRSFKLSDEQSTGIHQSIDGLNFVLSPDVRSRQINTILNSLLTQNQQSKSAAIMIPTTHPINSMNKSSSSLSDSVASRSSSPTATRYSTFSSMTSSVDSEDSSFNASANTSDVTSDLGGYSEDQLTEFLLPAYTKYDELLSSYDVVVHDRYTYIQEFILQFVEFILINKICIENVYQIVTHAFSKLLDSLDKQGKLKFKDIQIYNLIHQVIMDFANKSQDTKVRCPLFVCIAVVPSIDGSIPEIPEITVAQRYTELEKSIGLLTNYSSQTNEQQTDKELFRLSLDVFNKYRCFILAISDLNSPTKDFWATFCSRHEGIVNTAKSNLMETIELIRFLFDGYNVSGRRDSLSLMLTAPIDFEASNSNFTVLDMAGFITWIDSLSSASAFNHCMRKIICEEIDLNLVITVNLSFYAKAVKFWGSEPIDEYILGIIMNKIGDTYTVIRHDILCPLLSITYQGNEVLINKWVQQVNEKLCAQGSYKNSLQVTSTYEAAKFIFDVKDFTSGKKNIVGLASTHFIDNASNITQEQMQGVFRFYAQLTANGAITEKTYQQVVQQSLPQNNQNIYFVTIQWDLLGVLLYLGVNTGFLVHTLTTGSINNFLKNLDAANKVFRFGVENSFTEALTTETQGENNAWLRSGS